MAPARALRPGEHGRFDRPLLAGTERPPVFQRRLRQCRRHDSPRSRTPERGWDPRSFVRSRAFVLPSPYALALQPDGKILVCSSVPSGNGVSYLITRLNASADALPVTSASPRLGPVTFLKGGEIQVPVTGTQSPVVVQVSANLIGWTGLTTNAVVNGLLTFNDPLMASANARFYRLLTRP